jgi:hypothetical protein
VIIAFLSELDVLSLSELFVRANTVALSGNRLAINRDFVKETQDIHGRMGAISKREEIYWISRKAMKAGFWPSRLVGLRK